ncbi:Polyketide synthase [Hondaea fermentalgiana]|uniref:[acyl-carrier-protein] S-malonyltransferase n=1 Tax=Hondaea fermentalgiana TaxID=2315210 RepID=A0A2R5GS13_9STRA|nr:Polyketide synthase [Hondaea fermentalgiana]|eukprot:GBG32548.1 Polyketide synthase [Hondaea fermentalgiana]
MMWTKSLGLPLRTVPRTAKAAAASAQRGLMMQASRLQESDKNDFVLIFPGQGSQAVGRAQPWLERFEQLVQPVFDEVDEALQDDVCNRLLLRGPQDELDLTENAQPAIMALSIAVTRVLDHELGLGAASPHCKMALGHSLGEFTAMVATGALELADAARIVRARGRAMQTASNMFFRERADGDDDFAMYAIMPIGYEKAAEACALALQDLGEDSHVCQVANANSPKQVVLSGSRLAVSRAVEIAKEKFRARRATPLRVSAPFHCRVMADARPALEEALSAAKSWRHPDVPIISNVTAEPVLSADALQELALEQLTSTVRWDACVHTALQGAANASFIEAGGKVLSPLVSAVGGKNVRVFPVSDTIDLPTPQDFPQVSP